MHQSVDYVAAMEAQDKTKAIVIKTVRYGDSSLIVRLLTEDSGLQPFMVKGAFSKNAKVKAALFQPMTLLDIVRARSRSDLGFLKEASLNHTYHSIPFDMNKNAIVLFINELLSKTIQETETDTELFGFVYDALLSLDESEKSCADFPLKFSVELSRYLGFAPNTDGFRSGFIFNLEDGCFHQNRNGMLYVIDNQLTEKFFNLCNSDISENKSLNIRNSERRSLLDSVITYYKLHVAGFNDIKSCDILRTVLGSV